jgi:hypothetical protein
MSRKTRAAVASLVVGLVAAAATFAGVASARSPRAATPFLATLHTTTTIGSTVPPNGDLNPYGVVAVGHSVGSLVGGDYLISNFNAKSNDQGTGTTIVQMTPGGKLSVFAQLSAKTLPGSCPGGVGLTTALGLLPGGYVVVGSLPTTNGKSATAQFGCLIVLNSHGQAVKTIAGSNIQGPWDMATVTHGATTTLFVSNVLNGGAADGVHVIDNSTVVRIRLHAAGGMPTVQSEQVVATKIPWRDDKAALVIGPTGLALGSDGTLYVADTLKNRIIAIPKAMSRDTAVPDTGITLSAGGHLNQPLGLELAPDGDIITTNAGNGNIVETTPAGHQVATIAGDAKSGAGSLFGLLVAPGGKGLVYVDDGLNTLRWLH